MKRRLNIRGETLAETIIALSILAIGITMASTVIMNSMRNLANAKNRVIAVNIAREGIEAVRSIRDTNWLLYSDKRRQCWNHDPASGVACDGLNPIPPGTYIVYKFQDGSWHLQLADTNPSLDSDIPPDGVPDNDLELIALSLVDIDININSDGVGGDNDDLDMYNHMVAGVTTPFGTQVKDTPYSRHVVIEYLENKPDIATAPSNITAPLDSINTADEWDDVDTAGELGTLNRMRVSSVVSWYRGGISYTAELKTILTDHLGREDLTN